ncbi:MAG: carboxypeptidase regulatory-like domain-containing protein [Verrucomicrobia bacterium]|nr:carboxypeptidase regulatory-like domain-containing protein [Verrucomicrobiota bacterium]
MKAPMWFLQTCTVVACLLSAPANSKLAARPAAAAPEPVAVSAPDDPVALDERDREIDKAQLLKIYDAIQAYRQKHGQLPGWLADLFPEFLNDPGILVSPAEPRRGAPQTWGYGEPRMHCSYIYEFSQAEAGGRRDQGIALTMRQWKEIQMEEFGPVIPLLRCHVYDRVLNVSYSGDYYETALFWEQDTNTFALMQKLGPGPGAKDGLKLQVTALDAETGQPLADCQVLVTNRTSELGALPPRVLRTDAEGRCVVNLGGRSPTAATLRVHKPGHASAGMQWSQGAPPADWTATLSRAGLIGGVVRDPAGQPVARASVAIQGIALDVVGQAIPFEYDTVFTDNTGRWQSERVPRNPDTLTFKLTHPEFLPTEVDLAETAEAESGFVTLQDLLNRQAVVQLEPGFVIQGQVTSTDAQAVAGARVIVATGENLENRQTQPTGVDGRFRLVLLEAAEGQILVQARGFAPQQRPVIVDRDAPSLTITLAPSRLIRGRVLDGEDQPVPAATVHLVSMGQASLLDWRATTDAEGRFTCDGVPSTGFGFYATKPGYGSPMFQEIAADADGEIVVRLERSFQITGRVTDADTGMPVKRFKVIPGRAWGGGDDDESNPVQWESYRQLEGVDGSYTMPFEDQGGGQYKLLVVADGYLPAMTPLLSGRGQRTNDFALKPGKGPEGVVVDPARQPVEGVQVAILGFGYLSLEGTTLQSGGNEGIAMATTDARGQFELPAILPNPTLVAVHESGYAEFQATNLNASGTIQLQPWGRVEGVMKFGSRPAVDQEIALNSMGTGLGQLNYSHQTFKTQTDHEGRFAFDPVPPGDRQLVRLIRMGERSWMHSQAQTLTVKAGGVTEVLYGGTGRPVVGKFVLSDPDREVDWNKGHRNLSTRLPQPPQPLKTPEEWREWNNSPEFREAVKTMRHYAFQIDPDGAFRIEGVQAGQYTLQIHLMEPGDDDFGGGPIVGSVAREIIVPEIPGGTSDEPLDLDEIKVAVRAQLVVGQPAPPLEARTFDDQPVSLADYRGKLLLLCFWAMQAGGIEADLPLLEKLAHAHAANADLVILGITLDESVEDAADLVKQHNLAWPQGYFSNDEQRQTMQSYPLRRLPSYYLIDPDGNLVAKDLQAAELEATVTEALDPAP